MTDICEHGATRRKCETCEAYERGKADGIAEADARARVKAERLMEIADRNGYAAEFYAELDRDNADGLLAQRDARVLEDFAQVRAAFADALISDEGLMVSYQANVAMLLHDRYSGVDFSDPSQRDSAADDILDLIFGLRDRAEKVERGDA